MKSDIVEIAGKVCHLYEGPSTDYLLIQPIDEHDKELLDHEVETIHTLAHKPFSLLAFEVKDWNEELPPWPAPPVFGKVPFGNGAAGTFSYIANHLLPTLMKTGINARHYLLGGYSLAGLFSLWAAYQTGVFAGIAAVSPSVWYPGWIDYAKDKTPLLNAIYLSLGDKEEKTKNHVMAQVGNAIKRQYELLTSQIDKTLLEWNPGNHFVDSDKRMAKGFAWLINNMP